MSRRRLWERKALEAYRARHGRRRAARLSNLPLSPTVARWLPVIKRRIIQRVHPHRIVLFGSQARGEALRESDVDLLVVVPEGADEATVVHDLRVALARIPVSKDIFVTTPPLIDLYGDVIGTVLEPALREGVTIYVRA